MGYTTVDPNETVEIRMGASGPAARPPTTVVDIFKKTVKECGSKERDAVAIIGFNSPEWVFTWIGAVLIGAMGTGIYATNGADGVAYVVEHSKAKVVVAEGAKQLAKFREVDAARLASVLAFVAYLPEEATPAPIRSAQGMNWAGFLASGAGVSDDDVEAKAGAVVAGQCCSLISGQQKGDSTLIYTSGTTGNPKAVMISHDSLTWTAHVGFIDVFKCTSEEHVLSYLPLSHIAGQMMDVDTLGEVRPTVFFGVPRVWEKFGEAMKAKAATPGSMKDKVATFAKGCGAAKYAAAEQGDPDPNNCMANLVAGSIFGKIKGALGLDRCRLFATGAAPICAPITTDLLKYLGSLDINILELFGMSEVTGPTNMSTADNFRRQAASRSGTETACAKDTSEVIFRGRHVMMGYMYNQEATDKTIDADGWLHSGDVGSIDEDGYLKITGRIKEILITAAGENVAPVLIEDEIKRQLDCVANAMVVGDQKKFLTVLLTLKTKPDADGLPLGAELAKDAALCGCATIADAAASADYKKMIEDGLKKANANAISRAQNVQKFAILPVDFTQEGNELTPTMKLKRKVVLETYADVVAGLY
ncbi:decanoate-CoA ligase [Aureococcus anophagefferens]|nr:decanoate-CoA ligase [Aureococcus anophagefferens]